MAFRILAADNFPAHRTIREFRALHLSEFTELFVQVVRLVKLGTIAVDGTKIKANSSRHKAMSYGRMQTAEIELKAQISALVQKAAWKSANAKATPSVDAALTTSANPRIKTASPRVANPTCVTLVFLRPKPRTALPTPSRAS